MSSFATSEHGIAAASARIAARLNESFVMLETNGTSPSQIDAFAAFLSRPGTLQRPSLIVRCRFDGQSFDVVTIVDKPFPRRRVRDGLLPCLNRIATRLTQGFDVVMLISDTVYVEEEARREFLDFLTRVPFLRCDWLEGDPISSHALIMPDPWVQESAYAEEVEAIDRAAMALPFEERENIVKWRGGLSGPGYPDIDNCLDFPRYRLLLETLRHPNVLDARLTHYDNLAATAAGSALRNQLETWFGGTAPFIPSTDFTRYKYLISLDGVAASWKRVATILWSGSVLLMQHRWRQYFYPGLSAWEHYVPIANDLSDIVARFHMLEADPARALSIARNARNFARHFLTGAAVDDYMYTLLTRCARLL